MLETVTPFVTRFIPLGSPPVEDESAEEEEEESNWSDWKENDIITR